MDFSDKKIIRHFKEKYSNIKFDVEFKEKLKYMAQIDHSIIKEIISESKDIRHEDTIENYKSHIQPIINEFNKHNTNNIIDIPYDPEYDIFSTQVFKWNMIKYYYTYIKAIHNSFMYKEINNIILNYLTGLIKRFIKMCDYGVRRIRYDYYAKDIDNITIEKLNKD